jgi:ABC-type transport system involved in Fe-S cluster assembly fused permease/ATPase subunit
MCRRNNRDRGFYRCWKVYYYQFAKPFYEIDSGTICIDNENIENYTLGSKQIAVVLQDVFYLHTIFNITLNNPKKMFCCSLECMTSYEFTG